MRSKRNTAKWNRRRMRAGLERRLVVLAGETCIRLAEIHDTLGRVLAHEVTREIGRAAVVSVVVAVVCLLVLIAGGA